MTDAQKLQMVKTLLNDGIIPPDEVLNTYITLSGNEIIAWKYHLIGGAPSGAEVTATDEAAQIYAVLAGYTHAGSEGEKMHIENGVHRAFLYSDMLDYIHNHVLPYARVGAVT